MARLPRVRTAPAEAPARAGPVSGRLEDCWDEPEPVRGKGRTDLDLLQGAWVSIAGRRRAEFLISGTHFTVHFADGAIYMGSFTIDPCAWPRTMDVIIDEGPAAHRGQVALCIYEVDGDVLRWCTAGPGQPQRPMSLSGDHEPTYLSLVFRREHRHSPT